MTSPPAELNIADRLTTSASLVPHQRAIVFPASRDSEGRVLYSQLTFQQLEDEVTNIAKGLLELGVTPGTHLALFVPPSLESIALTFGVFRSGAVGVLIDPGMGRRNVFRCLDQCPPSGFIAIPIVHTVRRIKWLKYRRATINICIGQGIAAKGMVTYSELIRLGQTSKRTVPTTGPADPAAVIFTSGSTGPPKGVCYEHGMFDGQVDLIRNRFDIQPGEIDLPGFPLFALFNIAMQVTTVIPDMDPTRPASVDPVKILEAINDQGVTQAFGSPALWNTVGRYLQKHQITLPTLNRVLSAGAPVPNHVLERMLNALPEHADVLTPYGATECLPVAAIGGRQVLQETAERTAQGAGTCVGTVFDQMTVRIIETTFEPIAHIDDAKPVRDGQIGEIIVRGPVATRQYFQQPNATALAKISDGDSFWHRMGDVGYIDEHRRLWFCGRKAHIVWTPDGPLFSVRCEAIFNQHPAIYRSALVARGPRPEAGQAGCQTPLMVCEPEPGRFPESESAANSLRKELLALAADNPLTATIREVLFHRSLPVDTRHNVKINREELGVWAAAQTS